MKRLIIVTGSSRGIGKAIATEFNQFYERDTTFLLLARDEVKLTQVQNQIFEDSGLKNQAILAKVDFSKTNQVSDYFTILKNAFSSIVLNEFEELTVVYNHGTLEFGSVSLIAQEPLREKFETNLFSIWSLLSAINLLIPTTVIPRQFHVNISSGYANEAVAKWSGHCCARVARDMLFECFALEQPDLKVLNYEPGIVYTDMLKQANDLTDEFQEDYDSGNFTKPEDTARRLIEILSENKFASGTKAIYLKKDL